MIEVAQIIERLLLQNDCVIVPGLGGFVAQDCEACYVKEENIFLPPYRSVSFNPRLIVNDGLLINEYALVNDLTYVDAKNVVIREVEHIRHKISKYGKFNIPGVGTLTASETGNYEFTPLVCGIDSPEHFGLDSLYVPTIRELTRNVPVVEVNTTKPETVIVSIRKNAVRYVAAIAAAVAIFFICLMPFSTTDSGVAEAGMFEQLKTLFVNSPTAPPLEGLSGGTTSVSTSLKSTSTSTKGTAKRAEKGDAKKKASDAPQHSTATPATREDSPKADDNTHKPYAIILASAIPIEGAKRMVKNLKREGFKDVRIVDDRNMLRVVYGHFANSAEATQALREGRAANPVFDHAWILALQ